MDRRLKGQQTEGARMKNFIAGFVAGTFVLILGVLLYLRLGLLDIRSGTPVPTLTARFLYSAIHASVRRIAPKLQNPLPQSDETLIAGGKLYLNDCVGCHGEPGKPPSDFGATFYPPAPQFPIQGTNYSQAEVFWVAKHGIRRTGMAAQGSSYSDPKLWMLAGFISRFPNLPPHVLEGIYQKSTN
jgi:mono/diheme cytochrome c family protein